MRSLWQLPPVAYDPDQKQYVWDYAAVSTEMQYEMQ